MLRKRLHRSLTCPAGVLCAALYRCGTPHCLRLQHSAATTASYQTIQPEATEDNLRLSKLSLGVRKSKPKICQSWLGLWFFLLRRWSVVKLWLNICFFLLSCCRCLLGCMLLTSLSFELLCNPVSSLNPTSLLLSALVTLAKQPNQQGNHWAKAATPGSCGSLPSASDCIVSNNCTKWFTIITSF